MKWLIYWIFILDRIEKTGSSCSWQAGSMPVVAGTGITYKYFKPGASFAAAEAACVLSGGTLPVFQSQQELDNYNNMISSCTEKMWIGVKADCFGSLSSRNSYTYIDGTSTSGTISNWMAGQPSSNPTNDRCVYSNDQNEWLLSWFKRPWHNDDCNKVYPYVCQYRTTPITESPAIYSDCCTSTSYITVSSGLRYKFVSTAETFDNAEAQCLADGASLPMLLSSSEISEYKDLLKECGQDRWIGLIRSCFDSCTSQSSFKWLDGSPGLQDGALVFPPYYWESGKPDGCTPPKLCVITDASSFFPNQLMDAKCSDTHQFACQIRTDGATPTTTNVDPDCCPNTNWITTPSGVRYKYFNSDTQFQDAQDQCQQLGGNLPVCLSNTALNDLKTLEVYCNNDVWYGETSECDLTPNQASDFKTIDGSADLGTANWQTGDPSGAGQCVIMKKDKNFQFNDISCTTGHKYFCQILPAGMINYTLPNGAVCPTTTTTTTEITTTASTTLSTTSFSTSLPTTSTTNTLTTTKNKCPFNVPIADSANNIQYIFVNQSMTAADAQAYCASTYPNSNLPIFCTVNEMNTFASLKLTFGSTCGLNAVWLGMTRMCNTVLSNANFFWLDGSPVNVSQWETNEPNNYRNWSELCVNFYRSTNGDWFDTNCTLTSYFVCQLRPENVSFSFPDTEGPCQSTTSISTTSQTSVTITTVTQLSTTSHYCPFNVKLYDAINGIYYVYTTENLNALAAQTYCQTSYPGSNLPIIVSASEQQQLDQLTPKQCGIGWTWSGLYRQCLTPLDNSSYRWLNGNVLNYTNWVNGEPDQSFEYCIIFDYSNAGGQWRDVPCSVPANVVCQYRSDNVSYTYSNPEPPCYTTDTSTTSASSTSTIISSYVCPFNVSRNDTTHSISYIFTNVQLGTIDGQKYCASNYPGSNLPYFLSQAEAASLLSLILSNCDHGYYLSGFYRLCNTTLTNDSFHWISGDSLNYTNWNSGEPNNVGDHEFCMVMLNDFAWADVPCDYYAGTVICQFRPGNATYQFPDVEAPCYTTTSTITTTPMSTTTDSTTTGSTTTGSTTTGSTTTGSTTTGSTTTDSTTTISTTTGSTSTDSSTTGSTSTESTTTGSTTTVSTTTDSSTTGSTTTGSTTTGSTITGSTTTSPSTPSTSTSTQSLTTSLLTSTSTTSCSFQINDTSNHLSYIFIPTKLNFTDAQIYCTTNYPGSNLPFFLSLSEMEFFIQTINVLPCQQNMTWIGMYRNCKTRLSNDSFQWLDGSALNFTVWFSGQPNNYVSNGLEQLCVYIQQGQWNDYYCNNASLFSCQYRPENVSYSLQDPNIVCPSTTSTTTTVQSTRTTTSTDSTSSSTNSATVTLFCPFNVPITDPFNNQYIFTNLTFTFAGAQNYCATNYPGSNLPIFQSDIEMSFFNALYFDFASSCGLKNTWMGLYRLCNTTTTNSSFTWLDGSSLTFTNWKTNQPDNSNGIELCVDMQRNANNQWTDVNCNTMYYQHTAVCQIRPENITYTYPDPWLPCMTTTSTTTTTSTRSTLPTTTTTTSSATPSTTTTTSSTTPSTITSSSTPSFITTTSSAISSTTSSSATPSTTTTTSSTTPSTTTSSSKPSPITTTSSAISSTTSSSATPSTTTTTSSSKPSPITTTSSAISSTTSSSATPSTTTTTSSSIPSPITTTSSAISSTTTTTSSATPSTTASSTIASTASTASGTTQSTTTTSLAMTTTAKLTTTITTATSSTGSTQTTSTSTPTTPATTMATPTTTQTMSTTTTASLSSEKGTTNTTPIISTSVPTSSPEELTTSSTVDTPLTTQTITTTTQSIPTISSTTLPSSALTTNAASPTTITAALINATRTTNATSSIPISSTPITSTTLITTTNGKVTITPPAPTTKDAETTLSSFSTSASMKTTIVTTTLSAPINASSPSINSIPTTTTSTNTTSTISKSSSTLSTSAATSEKLTTPAFISPGTKELSPMETSSSITQTTQVQPTVSDLSKASHMTSSSQQSIAAIFESTVESSNTPTQMSTTDSAPTVTFNKCLPGFSMDNAGNSYFYNSSLMTMADAQTYCNSLSPPSNLPVFASLFEYLEFLKRMNACIKTSVWIGLYRDCHFNSNASNFNWINGQTNNLSFWSTNQPDNVIYPDGEQEQCVYSDVNDDSSWGDTQCSNQFAIVCQIRQDAGLYTFELSDCGTSTFSITGPNDSTFTTAAENIASHSNAIITSTSLTSEKYMTSSSVINSISTETASTWKPTFLDIISYKSSISAAETSSSSAYILSSYQTHSTDELSTGEIFSLDFQSSTFATEPMQSTSEFLSSPSIISVDTSYFSKAPFSIPETATYHGSSSKSFMVPSTLTDSAEKTLQTSSEQSSTVNMETSTTFLELNVVQNATNRCSNNVKVDGAGNSYIFVNTSMSMKDAQYYCNSLTPSSNLPIFRSLSEYLNFLQLARGCFSTNQWMGLVRACNQPVEISSFHWIDGSANNVQMWIDGQPNNQMIVVPDEPQLCVISEVIEYDSWRDIQCSFHYPFACQARPDVARPLDLNPFTCSSSATALQTTSPIATSTATATTTATAIATATKTATATAPGTATATATANTTGTTTETANLTIETSILEDFTSSQPTTIDLSIEENTVPLAENHCPGEFKTDTFGNMYIFVNSSMPMEKAQRYCNAMSLVLPIFRSYFEYTEFLKLKEQCYQTNFWMGLYRECHLESDASSFKWIDQTSNSLESWMPHQPNNQMIIKTNEQQQCVVTDIYANDKWRDIQCSFSYPFACQWRADLTKNISIDIQTCTSTATIAAQQTTLIPTVANIDSVTLNQSTIEGSTASEQISSMQNRGANLSSIVTSVDFVDILDSTSIHENTDYTGSSTEFNSKSDSPTTELTAPANSDVQTNHGFSLTETVETGFIYKTSTNSLLGEEKQPSSSVGFGFQDESSTSGDYYQSDKVISNTFEHTTHIQKTSCKIEYMDETNFEDSCAPNGICQSLYCKCSIPYYGDKCEYRNCSLLPWTEWSACSTTCGIGKMSRTRSDAKECKEYGYDFCFMPCDVTTTTRHPENPLSPTLQIVGEVTHTVACFVLMICVGVTFVIFALFNVKSLERRLHAIQEVLLFIGHTIILVLLRTYLPKKMCPYVGVSLQFLFLSNFAFLCLESVQTYCIMTNVLSSGGFFSLGTNLLMGFGIPAAITALTITLSAPSLDHYESDFSCWVNWHSPTLCHTVGPIAACSLVTIICTESAAMGRNMKKYPLTPHEKYTAALVRQKGSVFILLFNILSWLSSSLAMYHPSVAYFSTMLIFNACLGGSIAIFHIISNEDVHKFVNKKIFKKKSDQIS